MTGTKRTIAALLVGALAALIVAGCQRGGGGGEGEMRIALSVSTLNNPFFISLRDGARAEAEERGVTLEVADAQNDAAAQQDDVQNFVTQQFDAILVNPVDSEAIVPAIEAANGADIPVLALDRGASGGELVTTIASDNVEGGRIAGQELVDLVGEGPIAQLEGIPGTSAARDRGQGFEEAVQGAGSAELVASQAADFDRAEALDVAQNILQANPEVKGIFAQNDEMALGAVRALGDRAGDEVKVVGFDAVEDALAAIEEGRMNATIAQQPDRIGALGVENAVKAIDGGSVEGEISVEVKLVTQENVSEYME